MTTNPSENRQPAVHPSGTAEINPYAPSMLEPDPVKSAASVVGWGHVSTLALIVHTMAGVTVSGGVFGIGTLLIENNDPSLVMIGAIVGCFLAFFGSLAIVPLTAAGSLLVRTPGMHWTASSIRVFGAVSGFLTGFVCIAFLAGFSPWSIVIGFIPGAVGAVVTTISLIPLARRATRAWSQIDEIDDSWASFSSDQASRLYRP